jgi:cytochrome c-type biogenesis protein
MLPPSVESAISAGGLAAVIAVLATGLFIGLTPGAYVAGPAVLSYLSLTPLGRGALLGRALCYVVGAAVPLALVGLLLGLAGDVVFGIFSEQIAVWYLLVAVVLGLLGLVLTELVMIKLPSYLPCPRPVSSASGAFLLGLPLGLAACPACTPMLLPIATLASVSGGPVYGAGLLLFFGLARGIPILAAALSVDALRQLRQLIPLGLTLQRWVGWLLLATAGIYLLQAGLIVAGHRALFV